MLFKELKNFMKMEAKEHKEFIDAIIVNFVPMQICNIEKGFEPLLLSLYSMNLTDLSE